MHPPFKPFVGVKIQLQKMTVLNAVRVGKTRLNANGECVDAMRRGWWLELTSGECKCEAPNKQEDNACYTPKEYCNNVKDGECKPNTNSDACVEQ